MDYEVELNYRLTGHLEPGEVVISTLVSIQHGIYGATDRRILCVNTDSIGYRMRVHPYTDLERVEYFEEGGAWFVQFCADERQLTVRTRSKKEARRFVKLVSDRLEAIAKRVDGLEPCDADGQSLAAEDTDRSEATNHREDATERATRKAEHLAEHEEQPA